MSLDEAFIFALRMPSPVTACCGIDSPLSVAVSNTDDVVDKVAFQSPGDRLIGSGELLSMLSSTELTQIRFSVES